MKRCAFHVVCAPRRVRTEEQGGPVSVLPSVTFVSGAEDWSLGHERPHLLGNCLVLRLFLHGLLAELDGFDPTAQPSQRLDR